jgi:aspartyl-tRNA(Asn)/glutamyl-tRNA(Gln) amidotransferase subunit A
MAGGNNAIPVDVMAGISDGVAGLRLATLDSRDRESIDPDILDAYDETLRQFAALGAALIPMELPRPLAQYGDCFEIALAEAYVLHGAKAEDPSYPMDSAVRARILSGAMPEQTYIDACSRAQANAREFLTAMQGKDAFLLPTAPVTAIALSDVDEATTPATLTRFVNQLGLCALALPNGTDRKGLPTSLQIVCRPFHEALALRVGYAFEQSTDWHRRISPLVAG